MTEPVPGQTPQPAVADEITDTTETDAAAAEPQAAGPEPTGAVDPQELFGSLSLSAIEADIDRLMNDKMSQLDGMLAGLEELVQRLEGEITNLEGPPDEAAEAAGTPTAESTEPDGPTGPHTPQG